MAPQSINPKNKFMKKLFPIVLLLLLITSCGGKKQIKEDRFLILSGKITNFRKSKIKITNDYGFEKEIRFNRKKKTFKDTLRKLDPGHYTIEIGKRKVKIYLDSLKNLNENINIVVNAKRKTVDPVFTGSNANINNFLIEREKKSKLLLGDVRKLFKLKEDQFLSKMDKFKSELIDLAETSNLPTDYLTKEKNNIHYEFALGIKNYQPAHRILFGDDNFVVSDNFPKDVYESIDLNASQDYLFSKSYRDIIKKHIDDTINANRPNDAPFDFELAYLKTVNSEFNNPIIKNHLLFDFSYRYISIVDDLNEFYNSYKSFSTNEANNKKIDLLYDKLKLTAKGQPSPIFENIENYDGSKTSLTDITGKGKYVYIDIWATWCSFCKREIPLLKRFEQQFHDKNIEFVSISVDKASDKNKWKKTIVDREMGGIQLFSGKTQDEFQFTKDYLVKALPRFILIDPDGNIVSPNAPRPSDGDKLITLIEDLIDDTENSI